MHSLKHEEQSAFLGFVGSLKLIWAIHKVKCTWQCGVID